MKLPDVDYARPQTLKEAMDILVAYDGEAKVIAGGQSLMPMLAFRLLAPKILVDIGRLPGLNQIEITPDGVKLGALVTWRDIESHPQLASDHPLLVAAIAEVAHFQIRTRGTVGGSLAHCDPASEFPALVMTCGADVVVAGPDGERVVRGEDFIVGAMTTDLEPEEIIIQVRFPRWPGSRRWAFEEFARRRGDFAVAAAAIYYDLSPDGRAMDPHVGVIGGGESATRLSAVEDLLEGQVMDRGLIARARIAAEEAAQPPEDIHASARYRKALIGVLVERALARSAQIELVAGSA